MSFFVTARNFCQNYQNISAVFDLEADYSGLKCQSRVVGTTLAWWHCWGDKGGGSGRALAFSWNGCRRHDTCVAVGAGERQQVCCGIVRVALSDWHWWGGEEGRGSNGKCGTALSGWRRCKWKGCWWACRGVGGAVVASILPLSKYSWDQLSWHHRHPI